ncbi:MAG: septal ring lytic transglycosylase RlpA family protein [Pseudomonadota bacterium]
MSVDSFHPPCIAGNPPLRSSRAGRFLPLLLAVLAASGCAKQCVAPPGGYGRSYEVFGRTYQTYKTADGYVEDGLASWYGNDFAGRPTSSGETYNMYALTAAHKTLPLNTWVRVCNLRNDRKVVVRINDRGPFVDGRLIDLSLAGAKSLDMVADGLAPVRVEALGYKNEAGDYRLPSSYDAGDFAIQVGAFRDRANARRLAERLVDLGRAGVVLPDPDGEGLYRVRVAHYRSLKEARQGQEDMRRNGFSEAFVVATD